MVIYLPFQLTLYRVTPFTYTLIPRTYHMPFWFFYVYVCWLVRYSCIYLPVWLLFTHVGLFYCLLLVSSALRALRSLCTPVYRWLLLFIITLRYATLSFVLRFFYYLLLRSRGCWLVTVITFLRLPPHPFTTPLRFVGWFAIAAVPRVTRLQHPTHPCAVPLCSSV